VRSAWHSHAERPLIRCHVFEYNLPLCRRRRRRLLLLLLLPLLLLACALQVRTGAASSRSSHRRSIRSGAVPSLSPWDASTLAAGDLAQGDTRQSRCRAPEAPPVVPSVRGDWQSIIGPVSILYKRNRSLSILCWSVPAIASNQAIQLTFLAVVLAAAVAWSRMHLRVLFAAVGWFGSIRALHVQGGC
jgi:hypothetical protein